MRSERPVAGGGAARRRTAVSGSFGETGFATTGFDTTGFATTGSAKTSFANANVARTGACALLLALTLPACGRGPKPDTGAAAPVDPARTMNPADLRDVTASYRCDQGHRVDIVRDQVARVGLADGRVVKIEAIRNSTPPTYMDNGLIFSQVSDTTAKLDDRKGNTVSCTKTETLRPASSS